MTDGDVNKIGDLIDQKLKPIKETLDSMQQSLDSHTEKLASMEETLDSHTGSLMNIESTLEGYADSYKVNKGNIERLDERLSKTEDQLDIQVSPELTIQR